MRFFWIDYYLLKKSGLFNPAYYILEFPDVRKADVDPLSHFIRLGWREGRNPSEEFDTKFYLDTNPDVRQAGINPCIHYLLHGKFEGRQPRQYSKNGYQLSPFPIRQNVGLHPSRRRNLVKQLADKCLDVIRYLYHKLPLSPSFRYKLKTIITWRFSRPTNYANQANQITIDDREVEVNRFDNQPYSLSMIKHNPFKYGEVVDSYYSKLLGSRRPWSQVPLIDPPWYLRDSSGHKPSSMNVGSRPATKHLRTKFTIICLVDQTPAYLLKSAIQSLLDQSYAEWTLDVWVNEGSTWDVDILSMQYQEIEKKIKFRAAKFPEDLLSSISASISKSKCDYVIFLNPYDEIGENSLSTVAQEVAKTKAELVFSGKRKSPTRNRNYQEEKLEGCEVPFSQLIAIKKDICLKQINNRSDAAKADTAKFFRELLDPINALSYLSIDEGNYLFRPIPGRNIISFVEDNGKVYLEEETVPLQVLIDARLIGRKVTGTERYIKEILKGLSQLRNEFNLQLKAIAFERPLEAIEGVEFVLRDHMEEILNTHVFHKTFPVSDDATLSEMALAPSVTFTPLDLILFNNPDYFPAEENFYDYRKNMKTAVKLSDQIIAISDHGKAEIVKQLEIPGEWVKAIHLGIHADEFTRKIQASDSQFKNLNIPPDYYFFIGTDYPHKNLVTLLSAFKIVLEQIPKANLVIVGARYYIRPQPKVKELLKSLGDRVVQLGHVSDEALPMLYQRAKALVFPSLYEGFGLPILEAMASGTPVIATQCTSIPEVCGDAALLFDGYDAQRLADAMLRIWTDDELRDRLIESGQINVSRFRWENVARQTANVYRDAVKNAVALSPSQRARAKSSIVKSCSMDRPTILIVTHIRFYPPTAGNEQRLFKLVKYLKKLGYQILMLVNPFIEKQPLDNHRRRSLHDYVDYYEEVGEYPVKKYSSSTAPSPLKRSALLEKWQLFELTFCPDEMMARAKQLIEAYSPNIILAEYIWTSRIFELADQNTLKVIDLIDLFSQKATNVVQYGINDSLAMTAEEELEFTNRCDVALAIQDHEAGLLRELEPDCEVITAGIDYEIDLPPMEVNQEKSILILGSDNQNNVVGVNEFLNTAWPLIHEKAPDCALKIVGKVSNQIKGHHENVALIPYVEDLDPLYHEATVVINPVYAGTGLKIKSVEAIGHGKALVSWPEGVAGIHAAPDACPFIVIDSWLSMAERVVELFDNDGQRRRLEEAAREYSKSVFSAEHVYQQLGDRLDIHSRRETKILCLYLRYGPDDYPGGLDTLMRWYEEKQVTRNVSLTVWIIDNKIEKEFDGVDLESGFRLLSGDNAQREFSGFQKVITKYRKEIESYDVIHFVTSAFDQLYTGYRDYFDLNYLYPILHRPYCLGHIDTYDEPIELMGVSSQSWIRTCFFFLSPTSLYSIKDVNSLKERGEIFDGKGNFRENGSIDITYQNYIKRWLKGERMQGVAWHGAVKDGSEFMDKTLAILNEHMLSIKFRTSGVKLIDFYWLMRNIKEVNSSYTFPIPDSIAQVEIRQKDLFNIHAE